MATIRSEPLTYDRWSPHSYFRDLIVRDTNRGALERLDRHAVEMRTIRKEQDDRAWRSMRAGDFEYRVEPNRTDGEGGYLAPPAWLINLFATAKRPGRVLASLIPNSFALPGGISSVNLPILTSGTTAAPVADTAGVPDQDITDTAGSSTVVTIAGQADVPIQMLEQSPAGASLDWVIFTDLTDSSDSDLETQLLAGAGSTFNQITGVANVSGITSVTYTDASPSGGEMYPVLGKTAAQLADARQRPPEVFLMRSARWAWLMTQEDTQGLPFGIFAPDYLGADASTPDPIGGLLGWPTFLDEALPATLGATENEDQAICLRPSDLILFEGVPQTLIAREPLSGSLGVRIQMHTRVAAITSRYPTGIATVGGSGFVVQSGY